MYAVISSGHTGILVQVLSIFYTTTQICYQYFITLHKYVINILSHYTNMLSIFYHTTQICYQYFITLHKYVINILYYYTNMLSIFYHTTQICIQLGMQASQVRVHVYGLFDGDFNLTVW